MPKKQVPRKKRTSFLTPNFLRKQRGILNDKLAFCIVLQKSAKQGIQVPFCGEREADELEQALTVSERERAARQLEECGKIIPLVEKALQLIDNLLTKKVGRGEKYGTCLNCREQIPQKRLDAVPWALCCVHCQEEADMPLLGEFLLEDSLA